jgi:hypothetical protein
MTEPINPKKSVTGQIDDHIPSSGIDAEQSIPVPDEIGTRPHLTDHERCILQEFVMPYKQRRQGLSAGWCSINCKITVDEATVALRNLLSYKLVTVSNRRNMRDTCYALTGKGFAYIQGLPGP